MKLLLTSNGITNKSIKKALFELAGKPANEIRVAFIPTAANIEDGDKGWLIKDFIIFHSLNFKQLDIVDISAISNELWRPRIEEADILVFGGGNTFHLKYWLEKSGLQKILPELLETRVWVGISAGSIVAGLNITNEQDRITAKNIGEDVSAQGLGYSPFSLKPHYLSTSFNDRNRTNIKKEASQFEEPMYAIDDNTAIKISGDKMEIISEGKWEKFNQ